MQPAWPPVLRWAGERDLIADDVGEEDDNNPPVPFERKKKAAKGVSDDDRSF